ncbi:hypothetical protein CMI37_34005 [Candidatus Pacearchaeota archaeon]|nr:hypothetical protein [Candidatus Pacearchaeota archaeon]|tara:strand:+ start:340 stop:993 length:654 start_codon:yes stop_codon:yes gene_type:complete
MSHKKITVGGQAPDAAGNIEVGVSHLSDISGTPSSGEALVYGGAGWAPSTVSGSLQYIFISHRSGGTVNYNTSPASSMAVNDVFYVYDAAPLNTITGATINQTTASGSVIANWVNYITLPAGKYTLQSQALVEFSTSSGYLSTVFRDSGNSIYYSAQGFVGDVPTYGSPTATTLGHLDVSVNTDIYVKIAQANDVSTIGTQGTTPANYSAILIMRLE